MPSTNTPPNVPPHVKYPRGKSVVNPTKLLAGAAMVKLAENGVDLSKTWCRNRVLFTIAKNDPASLERLVTHITENACDAEKQRWKHILGNSMRLGIDWDTSGREEFDTKMAVLPYAVKDFRNVSPRRDRYGANASVMFDTEVTATVRQIRAVLPKGTDIGIGELFRAAMIVLEVKRQHEVESRIRWVSSSNLPEINKTNIRDVIFIAGDLEGVEDIMPELIRRNTTDREVVKLLLESSTKALMVGVL